MIRVVEGVRVCSETFPNSYELIDKAKGIAYHFKISVQDVLQELMYLEFINRKRKLENRKGYLICSLYQNSLTKYVRDQRRERRAREIYGGVYLTFDREELRNRLFIEELVSLLKGIDTAFVEMIKTIHKNCDSSLLQIYSCYYADDLSSHEFYQRLRTIKRIARAYMKNKFYMDKKNYNFLFSTRCKMEIEERIEI
jgi:hypothetical protein